MRNVLGKLNARDRTEAVTIALRRGIIQLWAMQRVLLARISAAVPRKR